MKLSDLEAEMLAALQEVLHAYRDYGSIATRDSEEYKSLTAVRRAIRHAKARQRMVFARLSRFKQPMRVFDDPEMGNQ